MRTDTIFYKLFQTFNTLLFELFRPYGFTEAVLADLQKSWFAEPGRVFRSLSHQLLLDRNKLILSRVQEPANEVTLIHQEQGEYFWKGRVFKSKLDTIVGLELIKTPHLAQLDFDLLQFPLKLRTWQNGDSFQPLGMKGRKKLSDFFIEQKISLNRKQDIGVLENGNGDIIWIAGFRIDEGYKISMQTKKVFILEQF